MGTLQISIKAKKLGIAIRTTLQNIWPRAQINVHYACCNRARLYVTKQFWRFHFVVLFILVPMENVRFGHALWSSSSVVFLPHDACAGRQMIKFITL